MRQSGDMLFQLGDIYNDADILKQANEAVSYLEKNKFPFETLLEGKETSLIQL